MPSSKATTCYECGGPAKSDLRQEHGSAGSGQLFRLPTPDADLPGVLLGASPRCNSPLAACPNKALLPLSAPAALARPLWRRTIAASAHRHHGAPSDTLPRRVTGPTQPSSRHPCRWRHGTMAAVRALGAGCTSRSGLHSGVLRCPPASMPIMVHAVVSRRSKICSWHRLPEAEAATCCWVDWRPAPRQRLRAATKSQPQSRRRRRCSMTGPAA